MKNQQLNSVFLWYCTSGQRRALARKPMQPGAWLSHEASADHVQLVLHLQLKGPCNDGACDGAFAGPPVKARVSEQKSCSVIKEFSVACITRHRLNEA